MHQDALDLIGLLDLDADAHAVHARFDQHLFVLVPRHRQRVQQHFVRASGFDLRYVVPFRRLRGEVGEGEGGGEGGAHALEVGAEGLGLLVVL